jgi:hypothetical protein
MNTRKFIYAALFLLATSVFSQQVLAQQTVAYWDQNSPLPTLYFFRLAGANPGTGVRTTYIPTLGLGSGRAEGFRFGIQPGNILLIQFVTGLTIVFQLGQYDPVHDILPRKGIDRESAGLGPGPWYGCRSGVMPPLIVAQVCGAAGSRTQSQTHHGLSEDLLAE